MLPEIGGGELTLKERVRHSAPIPTWTLFVGTCISGTILLDPTQIHRLPTRLERVHVEFGARVVRGMLCSSINLVPLFSLQHMLHE